MHPLVFLVLSYRMPRLVDRLVGRLAETRDAITVVHHDPRWMEKPSLEANPRAMFMPRPRPIGWGQLNTVTTILACMEWIRDEIGGFSHVVLLSGQDYPVRSPQSIEAELLETDVDAFIHWEFVPAVSGRLSSDWQRGMSRRYYWHRIRSRPLPIPRLRFFFDEVGIFAGAVWWNLGPRAVERILGERRRLEYLANHRFKKVHIADEAFFQTALLNAPHGLKIVNDHRRFYRFPNTGGSGHPDTLTISDLEAILASRAFFARKVDEITSRDLLDRLDDETKERSGRESKP